MKARNFAPLGVVLVLVMVVSLVCVSSPSSNQIWKIKVGGGILPPKTLYCESYNDDGDGKLTVFGCGSSNFDRVYWPGSNWEISLRKTE